MEALRILWGQMAFQSGQALLLDKPARSPRLRFAHMPYEFWDPFPIVTTNKIKSAGYSQKNTLSTQLK